MKKLLINMIALTIFSNVAMADCDYTKIVKNNDGTYTYSAELHVCVGKMKQDLDISTQQNSNLIKSLSLKDLALDKANQRADLWKDSTFKLEDRINSIDSLQKKNDWMFFGLGVVTVLAAGYVASRAYSH